MINLRAVSSVLCATIALGCSAAAPPTETVRPPAPPTGSPLATFRSSAVPSPSARSTQLTAATPTPTVVTLGLGEQVLAAGTYRMVEHPEFPPILVNTPAGWQNLDGWAVRFRRPGQDVASVAVQLWDVDEVYGHPCQWNGTLLQPGPSVDGLVAALQDVPLRNATEPRDVTIDGYAGKHLEWSVPADFDFSDCDTDGGDPYFKSWTGNEWASERSQQRPGQVDRLWILDVGGSRLVIDSFEMPDATVGERDQLTEVVESIRFER